MVAGRQDSHLWTLAWIELVVVADGMSNTVRDVLVGDVWHASGQSHIAMTMQSVANRLESAAEHFRNADLSGLRFRRFQEGHSELSGEGVGCGLLHSSEVAC